MAGLRDMVAALLGRGEEPAPPTVTHRASKPEGYPTSDDVTFARKQDFSYGQPWAREFTGSALRVLDSDPNKTPIRTAPLSWEVYKTKPELWDVHGKAALAAQNSALATLGYDPGVTALDVSRDPKKVNLLGRYTKGGPENLDDVYSNAFSPATLIHESLHRGVGRLAETKHWKPEFDRYGLAERDHELVVRWLMNQKMGDPEKPERGELVPQRSTALTMFGVDSPEGAGRRKVLDDMEAAAAKYLAEKRPRGPR